MILSFIMIDYSFVMIDIYLFGFLVSDEFLQLDEN